MFDVQRAMVLLLPEDEVQAKLLKKLRVAQGKLKAQVNLEVIVEDSEEEEEIAKLREGGNTTAEHAGPEEAEKEIARPRECSNITAEHADPEEVEGGNTTTPRQARRGIQ